jgi:hypothetical protein
LYDQLDGPRCLWWLLSIGRSSARQGRYLNTSLRTKMPMSSSSTTTMRMNSIMTRPLPTGE